MNAITTIILVIILAIVVLAVFGAKRSIESENESDEDNCKTMKTVRCSIRKDGGRS